MDVMSRSRRKPYVKDKGLSTHEYWSKIRHTWKQRIRQFPNELWRGRFGYWEFDDSLPNPKSIIDDYDYCDWYWFVEYRPDKINRITGTSFWSEEDVKIHSRK